MKLTIHGAEPTYGGGVLVQDDGALVGPVDDAAPRARHLGRHAAAH